MNSKKLKPIPKFKSLEEEANFWDTANSSEYFDFSKAKWVRFVLEKPKKESVLSVRLQTDLINKVRTFAKKNNITVSSLTRTWFTKELSASYAH